MKSNRPDFLNHIYDEYYNRAERAIEAKGLRIIDQRIGRVPILSKVVIISFETQAELMKEGIVGDENEERKAEFNYNRRLSIASNDPETLDKLIGSVRFRFSSNKRKQ